MFSEKKLKVEITLYDYKTNNDGKTVVSFSSGKVLTFDNYRIDCKIKKVPSPSGYTASLDIYGVSKQSLDSITTLAWIDGKITPKGIKIYEGDSNLLFEGGIMEAVPNYKSVPDVSIHIESSMLVYPNLMATPPSLLSSDTNISDFLLSVCNQYNYGCSCSASLDVPWKGDSQVFDQEGLGHRIKEACKLFNINYYMTPAGFRFFAKNEKARNVYQFNPTNYDGYPRFENFGCCITTDDLIDINCGDLFRIKDSVVPYANAYWNTNMIEYNLQSRKPNGKWEMSIHGSKILLND